MFRYLNLSQKSGWCSIKGLKFGKKGRLYVKFVLAAAILIAAVYAYSAFAAVPSATPAIVNTNTTTINGVPIANVSLGGDCL